MNGIQQSYENFLLFFENDKHFQFIYSIITGTAYYENAFKLK